MGRIRGLSTRTNWGCLRCQVTWTGERICWMCGDDLFIVGASSLASLPSSNSQAVRYF